MIKGGTKQKFGLSFPYFPLTDKLSAGFLQFRFQLELKIMALPHPQALFDRTTHYMNSLHDVLCCGESLQRTMGCDVPSSFALTLQCSSSCKLFI